MGLRWDGGMAAYRHGRRPPRAGAPRSARPADTTWRRAALPLLALLVACDPRATAPVHPAYGPTQLARSSAGVVVSGSAVATTVGVRVLEAGGNAVDAAVATAFVLAVVEPTMSGIGGRTQMVLRTADGAFAGFDGTTAVPTATPADALVSDPNAYGYETIGVPGTVAALAAAHGAHGSLPWRELVLPAVELAQVGFALPAPEAARIAALAGELAEFDGTRHHFLRADGTPYAAGDRFRQPDLARVLSAVADGGADAFYRGWVADSIAADVRRHGGFVTAADLARYAAEDALVVRGSYRGYEIVGTYLPASGATTIEALHILENFDLTDRAGTVEWVALAAQALLLAFEDRATDAPGPEHAARLVSKAWAAQRAEAVRDPSTVGPIVAVPLPVADHEPAHTTHLSVADARGGLVALTQSIGPIMGSRVATRGLGFVYAATMGYLGDLEPGERPSSSQSPFLVLRQGAPTYVLGAAGARRIISALVEVVSRAVDQRLSLADAMALPRFHPTADALYLEDRPEARWPADAFADLASFGFDPEPRASAPFFARIHGIEYDGASREYVGAADPRWGGMAGAASAR